MANAEWSSRIGFILASAGSAIGLGAIWKFPFWAGVNGGGAFIIPYIIFTFTIGVALVMAEVAIGRSGRGSALNALRSLGGKTFGALGAFSVFTSFLILSYYSVVGGWCVHYLVEAFTGSVTSSNPEALKAAFNGLVSNDKVNIGWHFVFLTLTCAVVVSGVEAGIERLSKYLMPTLFVLMLVIIVRSLMLPGSWEGVKFLFDFSFDKLTPASVLNAMGFTFFSLSLGAGILVTYGSYLSERTSIPGSSMWVAVLAIQAALLAGLMIMPAVFAFGMEPNAGPGLVFITVPMIFDSIPFGGIFAVLFYICLLTAALTSSVSLLEVVIAFMQNEWKLSRRVATAIGWVTLFFLGCVSALSFGAWKDITIFGRSIFDFIDFVCTNFFMPLGGLAIAILAGWKCWPTIRAELVRVEAHSETTMKLIRFTLMWLSPVLVIVAVYQGIFG